MFFITKVVNNRTGNYFVFGLQINEEVRGKWKTEKKKNVFASKVVKKSERLVAAKINKANTK